jgi:hypothetical protein
MYGGKLDGRFGYRRINVMLQRERIHMNHKNTVHICLVERPNMGIGGIIPAMKLKMAA